MDNKDSEKKRKRAIIEKVNQAIHEKVEACVEKNRASIEAEFRNDGCSDEEIKEAVKEIKRNLQVKMINAYKNEVKEVSEERKRRKYSDAQNESAQLCNGVEISTIVDLRK